MAKSETLIIPNAGKDVEQQQLLPLLAGMHNGLQPLWKIVFQFLYKIKTYFCYDPIIIIPLIFIQAMSTQKPVCKCL